VLAARARSVRGPCRDRLRATIVLAAAAGQASAAIARKLGVCADTVRKWRRRFTEGRLAGLAGAPRSGRPPVFTAADQAEVIALACALPAESGVSLPKWSCPDLARELAVRCHITVSASTVGRWLARDALKPWQHRSWISVRDPQFAARAARVLDLYARTLLLRRPAQSPHTQRLHQPGPHPRTPRRIRDPLQRHRPAFHLEVHPHRPQRPATPHRRPRQDPAQRPGSMIPRRP
jgi:transposase-like protein